MRDLHTTTVADAARAARDEEPRPEAELTWREAEAENDYPPPENHCGCGNPLPRVDGWRMAYCAACMPPHLNFTAPLTLPRGGGEPPGLPPPRPGSGPDAPDTPRRGRETSRAGGSA
jgi:hypothetical protein